MNLFYSIAKAIVYLPFKILFPTKIIGKRNFPRKTKVITVSNHISWTDIPVVAVSLPGYRHFIAKKEIGRKPFVRWLTKSLGAVFVDRGKADMASMRETIGLLKKGESISIFPEGTRNKVDTSMNEVKSGIVMFSVKGDAPVVPVMIYGKGRVFRRNYIYVGVPFELTQIKNRRLDTPAMNEGVAAVTAKMEQAKELLDFHVENRKKKDFKLLCKQAKRARKKALKYAAGCDA